MAVQLDLLAEDVKRLLGAEMSDAVSPRAMGWDGEAARAYAALLSDLREDISVAAAGIAALSHKI